MNPQGEPEPVGYAALAPVDDFLQRHRVGIVAGTRWRSRCSACRCCIGCSSTSIRSICAAPQHGIDRDLCSTWQSDPAIGINSVDVVAPCLADAPTASAVCTNLPEVERTMTLDELHPAGPGEKLADHPGARQGDRRLRCRARRRPARRADAENVDALTQARRPAQAAAGNAERPGRGGARKRLATT